MSMITVVWVVVNYAPISTVLHTSIIPSIPLIAYPTIYPFTVHYPLNISQSYTKIYFIFYLHYPENVLYFKYENK